MFGNILPLSQKDGNARVWYALPISCIISRIILRFCLPKVIKWCFLWDICLGIVLDVLLGPSKFVVSVFMAAFLLGYCVWPLLRLTLLVLWFPGWTSKSRCLSAGEGISKGSISMWWNIIQPRKGTKYLYMLQHAAAKSLQLCPTLCDPLDGSPPGSPVPRILQARILEWVAIAFSNAWKWKVKVKSLSRVQLNDPMDCSLPGSSIHGIFKARVLEWGANKYCRLQY